MTAEELIAWAFENELLLREQFCSKCSTPLKYERCKSYADSFCWRCTTRTCMDYQKRTSIRSGSFFEGFGLELKKIIKVLLRYSIDIGAEAIFGSVKISKPLIRKILKGLIRKMDISNKNGRKLGGPGKIVQVDETMLNYSCKSHRGRSPGNKIDALCIVECSPQITRVWAEGVPDKKRSTILPIICERVVSGSRFTLTSTAPIFV
ncbi:MAG: hypothetical protein ACRC1D_04945 [Culicoidibacterales bacterium]